MSLKKESLTDVQLHKAAAMGHMQTVRCLLNSGKVHVDSRDKEGTTPLMLATAGGHFQCCSELLRNGANPRARRQSGATALFFAAQGGYMDIVQLLLSYYPADGSILDAQCKDGATALIVAAQYGHSDVVQELLDRGASIRLKMKDGASALFLASQNGHSKVVSQLLEKTERHKVDWVSQKRQDGATPLWIACQMGFDNIARLLLKAGASVNISRLDGVSPLQKACQKGHTDTVWELLRWKPFVGIEQNGEGPLHVSVGKGYIDIVRILLQAGADPFLPNRSGVTPYHIAVQTRQERMIQMLQFSHRQNSTESPNFSSSSPSPASDL